MIVRREASEERTKVKDTKSVLTTRLPGSSFNPDSSPTPSSSLSRRPVSDYTRNTAADKHIVSRHSLYTETTMDASQLSYGRSGDGENPLKSLSRYPRKHEVSSYRNYRAAREEQYDTKNDRALFSPNTTIDHYSNLKSDTKNEEGRHLTRYSQQKSSIQTSLSPRSDRFQARSSQSLQSSGTQKSFLVTPESGYGDGGYTTLLIKARPGSFTGDNNLPVEIVAARGGGSDHSRESQNRNSLKEPEQKKKILEPEYHSDKHFSNHFLNSNPKLEEMLMKRQK